MDTIIIQLLQAIIICIIIIIRKYKKDAKVRIFKESIQ